MALPHGGVNIRVSRITPSARVPVDPLQPMLCTMARYQVLQIVGGRNALGLSRTEKVLRDWIGVIAEGNLGVNQHRDRQNDPTGEIALIGPSNPWRSLLLQAR